MSIPAPTTCFYNTMYVCMVALSNYNDIANWNVNVKSQKVYAIFQTCFMKVYFFLNSDILPIVVLPTVSVFFEYYAAVHF